jgi:hypothetical protein
MNCPYGSTSHERELLYKFLTHIRRNIYLDNNEVVAINSIYLTDVIRYLSIYLSIYLYIFIYRGINNDVDGTVIISSIGF